jgi:transcriptional regulator with XRE-family HTH domain
MLPDELTLAARIEWLIQYKWPKNPSAPRTNAEAAAVITAATGTKLSSTTIWKLRTGRDSNPAYITLTALTRFFSVDLNYFGDTSEAERICDQIMLEQVLGDCGAGKNALQAVWALSCAGRQAIAEIAEKIATLERHYGHGRDS